MLFKLTPCPSCIVSYCIEVFHSSKIILIFNSLLQILYSEPGFGPMFYLVKNLPAFTDQEFRIEMCNSVGCINSSDTTAKTLLSGKSLTLQTYDSGKSLALQTYDSGKSLALQT